MKTRLLMITLAATCIAFTSCNDDDNNIKVSTEIRNAFQAQYPDATRVEWEIKTGYYVAEFLLNGSETEAWYNSQGIWYLTETDLTYTQLPEAIKTTHSAGQYAAWHIDDIDKLESPDMETVYIIEVEQGNTEYDLYYSPDGVFIKAILDQNNQGSHVPSTLLPAIKQYIEDNYPDARIVDVEKEGTRIEVDIVDGQTPREVVFSQTGDWIHTKTEIRNQASVPTIVMDAWRSSQYSSWRIDDIGFYDTTTVDYYLFELESGNSEVHLKIDPNGSII